jgi:hypothetical protein
LLAFRAELERLAAEPKKPEPKEAKAAPQVPPKAQGKPKPAPKARRAKATAAGAAKHEQVIELLRRPEGATTEEIMAATGWLRHTTRGWLSTARSKKGLQITEQRISNVGPNAKDGTTRYRISVPA